MQASSDPGQGSGTFVCPACGAKTRPLGNKASLKQGGRPAVPFEEESVGTTRVVAVPNLREGKTGSKSKFNTDFDRLGADTVTDKAPSFFERAGQNSLSGSSQWGDQGFAGSGDSPWPKHLGNDTQTGVIETEALQASLRRVQALEDDSDPQKKAASALQGKESKEKKQGKRSLWVLGSSLGAFVVLLVGGMLLFFGSWAMPWSDARYLSRAAALFSGPGAHFSKLVALPRGSKVDRVEDRGEFVLVRDLLGHVGYISARALLRHAPTATPNYPFAGCHRGVLEVGRALCETRARKQLDGCWGHCATESKNEARQSDLKDPLMDTEESCERRCRAHFKRCLLGCDAAPQAPAK